MLKRIILVACLAGAIAAPGRAMAETLDRIAVTVGPDVITESDLIRDLRVTAFLEHKPVDLSAAARRQAAQRMVDQILILREAVESHVSLPSTEAAAGLVAPYKADANYQADLGRYGISERDLSAHLLAGLRTLAFTDLRFRPDVQVSAEDVRNYYDELARQNTPNAARLGSLEENRDQIQKLLIEQRVMQSLDQWLETARAAANIRYRDKAFE